MIGPSAKSRLRSSLFHSRNAAMRCVLLISLSLALSADSSAPELGLGFQTKASNENS